MYSINGNIIETDKQGYLTDLNQWSRPLAELIAEQEQINMTEAHWEVVVSADNGGGRFC